MGGALSAEDLKEKPYPKTEATLYYFKGRGLADQARWLMAYTGVSFAGRVVDTRARFQRLAAAQLPFGQLPLLQIDGVELVQSQTIIRYLAKRANLMGASPKEEVYCDMIAETVRDLINLVAGTAFARRRGAADLEAHIRTLREKWQARASRLELGIKANGGQFLVGKSVTYADVLVAHCLTWYVEEVRNLITLCTRFVQDEHN
jgi:glutathione S-transferase